MSKNQYLIKVDFEGRTAFDRSLNNARTLFPAMSLYQDEQKILYLDSQDLEVASEFFFFKIAKVYSYLVYFNWDNYVVAHKSQLARLLIMTENAVAILATERPPTLSVYLTEENADTLGSSFHLITRVVRVDTPTRDEGEKINPKGTIKGWTINDDLPKILANQIDKTDAPTYIKEMYEKLKDNPYVAIAETDFTNKDVFQQVMDDRNDKYGNAWLLTGMVRNFIRHNTNCPDGFDRLFVSGYDYVWDVILCKLIRAISSPNEKDHWIDISVYAKLVANHIDDPNYMGG